MINVCIKSCGFILRYCRSGCGRDLSQPQDHQETTKGQCVRVPGGRGGNQMLELID